MGLPMKVLTDTCTRTELVANLIRAFYFWHSQPKKSLLMSCCLANLVVVSVNIYLT
jgi:hypothetical protein